MSCQGDGCGELLARPPDRTPDMGRVNLICTPSVEVESHEIVLFFMYLDAENAKLFHGRFCTCDEGEVPKVKNIMVI